MSVVRFEIHFDNPFATYFYGQHVTGWVLVELLKEKKIRALDLKFLGEAKVEWSETSGESTTYYSNNEIYLKNSVTLAGGTSMDITLPPGIHTYPFRLILPLDIPSSFESRYGYVRYTAKAAIRRSGRFDHHCKSAFTVLCPLDLNNEPDILKPVRGQAEKKLFFGFVGAPISIEASLPFSGYVPGQNCQADFEFKNLTTNSVSLKAYIVQTVTLKAKGYGKKVERNSICKEPLGNFSPQGSIKSSVGLQIPVVPNSYLHNCKFIDISYTFEIKGRISGPHRDVCVSIPIVIGSIPLRAQFNYLVPWEQYNSPPKNEKLVEASYTKEEEAQSSTTATSSPNPFFSYPEMPPPSYHECIEGTNDIRNEEDNEYVRGQTTFAPRYPVYSFKENLS